MAHSEWQSFTVGDLTVTQISDGASSGPRAKWFDGVDPSLWLPAMGLDHPESPVPVNFGIYLVTGDGHTTLIDSGFGPAARANPAFVGGGKMLDHLREIGVHPHQVDRIVQTHLHADHCGWMVEENAVMFPRATVHVNDLEVRYWEGEEVESHVFNQRMAREVRDRIDSVRQAGLLRPFVGDLVLSATTSILWTPGHTPGHSSVLINSGGQFALLLGDVAHHPVHLEHHDWLPDVDTDRELSVQSRRRVCEIAADTRALVTAPHMPVLTLGRLRRALDGYVYEPVNPEQGQSVAEPSP